jgi:hypothetical protein
MLDGPPPGSVLPPWPDILPGTLWVPDDDDWPRLTERPQGVVIHSGSRGENVGEYAVDEPDGRDIAYHFAWFGKLDVFGQTVSLRERAGHAGRAGNHWWGIAFPGPWNKDPRSEQERLGFQLLIHKLRIATGGFPKYYCRHSDIADKRDPGPGFKDQWALDCGLVWKKAS